MTSIGYQVSSLKDYLTTPESVFCTFRRLKEIGYRYVQLQWIHPDVPMESVKEALDETGLVCIATQDGFQEVRKDLDRFIAMNRIWNSSTLCISTVPKDMMTEDGIEFFCTEMKRIAMLLKEKGIGLTFHPLWYNFDLVNGIRAIDKIMEDLPDEIGLTLCIYHAVKAGADPVSVLERYMGRIHICHFKDYTVFPDGSEHLVPVGQGKIDWPIVFNACIETGVMYGLSEQESHLKDPFLCAKESLDYILSTEKRFTR
jgi:sugar phosphate isomerase/epimerase